MADFEDAVLAAAAQREKAGFIITRNVKDFANSPVRVITPAEFIAKQKTSKAPIIKANYCEFPQQKKPAVRRACKLSGL